MLDAYTAYCYLKGKEPSFKEYSVTDFETMKSLFPYPADIVAAYHRIKVAGAKAGPLSQGRKLEEACNHFDEVCKRHG